MTDRYPTLEEFWARLDARDVEDDLRETYRSRASRTAALVGRVGTPETVVAFVEAILPGAAVPAAVLAGFLDENFDKHLGRGDEKQGTMPRAELIPAGFAALDSAAGGSFAASPTERRTTLLSQAEQGKLPGPDRFDSKLWFNRTRDYVLLGYASDPRGMVEMGFPGPSYRPGYLWIGYGGPPARAARKPGHTRF